MPSDQDRTSTRSQASAMRSMPGPQQQAMAKVLHLAQAGRLEDAADAAQALLHEHPALTPARMTLAGIRASQGRHEEAVRHLGIVLEQTPDHALAKQMIGAALMALGRTREAISWLRQLAESQQAPAPLLRRAATDLLKLDDAQAAVIALQRARSLEPASLPTIMQLVEALNRCDRIDESLKLLTDELTSRPDDPTFRADVASALERANYLDEACRILAEAPASAAEHPALLVIRGRIALRQGDATAARPMLERALAGGDGKPQYLHPLSDSLRQWARRALWQACEQLGDYDAAFRWMSAEKRPPSALSNEDRAFLKRLDEFMAVCRSRVTPQAMQRWHVPPHDARRTPAFLVGFTRSGTTLLEQVLAAHPDIVTTDEGPAMHQTMDEALRRHGAVMNWPGSLDSLSASDIQHLREVYWEATDRRLGASPAPTKLVVDKEPLNTPCLLLARRLFPEAKVLFTIRDPRDVCLSCFANLFGTAFADAHYFTLETTARAYAAYIDLGLHFEHTLGLPWMQVKYEDMIADTRGMAQKVIEFLGVPWTDEVMQYAEKASHKFIRTPSYQAVTKTTNRSAEGRWRRYARHFDKANEILQPFVERFGYAE